MKLHRIHSSSSFSILNLPSLHSTASTRIHMALLPSESCPCVRIHYSTASAESPEPSGSIPQRQRDPHLPLPLSALDLSTIPRIHPNLQNYPSILDRFVRGSTSTSALFQLHTASPWIHSSFHLNLQIQRIHLHSVNRIHINTPHFQLSNTPLFHNFILDRSSIPPFHNVNRIHINTPHFQLRNTPLFHSFI
uniref:Uncharacterized protein n=1 Tax=Sphaerodactylus townsendi TaxID=933632 RepID=A0ACB8FCQ1_9SAUR